MDNEPNNQNPQPSGLAQPPSQPQPDAGQQPVQQGQALGEEENPNKSYLVALLLSYLLGSIGADRFYLGKIGTGVAKLLTLGGLGIWHLVDMLLVAFNKLHEQGDDRPLEGYAKNRAWVKILAIVLLVTNVVIMFVIFSLLFFATTSGIQSKARDTERRTDLNAMQAQVEAYFTKSGSYPTLVQMNDDSFRAANLQGLDAQALKDPQGDATALSTVAREKEYAYETSPSGCGTATNPCTSYILTATLEEEGRPFVVRSLY